MLLKKYNIREKNDFYRLTNIVDEINIYKLLKLLFPDEKWQKNIFKIRSKKSKQFLLFIFIQQFYPTMIIIENYRHPFLQSENERALEFDVYIPALNIGFEYQGEHHYDDMPAAYGQFELFLERDLLKEKLSKENNIQLIRIPYWWNQSPSSLQLSINSQLSFQKKID